jgi:hypothetical protein
MNLEQQLLDLILSSPKTKKIKNMAEELEKESKFTLSNDVEKLKGIWELRWSSSKAPFLNYSPLVDNLQILDPLNLNGLNLLKPRGINSIIGTGIVAKLSSLNEKKIGVSFTHAGIIGPYIGIRKINALTKIKKEQKGWLEITFLSKNLRICRGDKGTLFILRRIKDNILFERFQEFIESL